LLARKRRFRAASLRRLAGDIEHAVALLRELLEEVPPGVERADVWLELLMTERGPRTQIELCDEALADAAGDEVRSARVLRWRAGAHLMAGDARAALADAHAALELAERADDPILLAGTIAWVALIETYRGETTPGLLERGLELEKLLGLQLEWNDTPRYMLARRLTRLGEIERARGIWEELESDALERGDEGSRLILLWQLSMLEWLAGRWGQALEQAIAAYELTEQTQHGHAWTWVGRAKALIEADLGLVEQARLSAEEGLAHSESTSRGYYTLVTLGVLGRLELALGNLEAADKHLRDLPGRLLAGGMSDPAEPLWADAIETLVALGELEQARAYLEQYEASAQRLGSPWALAAAARCRGLLSGAEGDLSAATAAFESSLADAAAFPLERGRALLCLGVVRRQAQEKRSAREALEQALAIFEELGARLWAEKARAELRRISGRAPGSDELTETERRVAELAAQGHTNKEIAADLFMGVSTVEAHLSRVYRKLGIRSRAQLGGRMPIPRDEVAQA
jgi:DNA-binding CsgD family transcriptional regulator